jgi:VanZ family protein
MTMRKARYFIPAILYYILVFAASSQDIDIPLPGRGFDKVAHFIEFSFLGLFLSLGYFNVFSFSTTIKAFLVFITGLPLGILDELHQRFVPGRTSAASDAVADAAGIIAGILAYWYFARRKKRRPEGGVS